MLKKFLRRWLRVTQSSQYSILITHSAENDRVRVEQYAAHLETRSRRILVLSNAVLALKSSWLLCPYFDRELGVRVCYVQKWYSVFFTVDELEKRIVVIAILGQAEDVTKVFE